MCTSGTIMPSGHPLLTGGPFESVGGRSNRPTAMTSRHTVIARSIEDHLQRADTHYRELHAEYTAWHKKGDWGRSARPDLPCSRVTGYMGLIYLHLDVRGDVALPPWGRHRLQGDIARLAARASDAGYTPILRRGTLTIIDTKMAHEMTSAGLRLPLQDDIRGVVRWNNYEWAATRAMLPIPLTGGCLGAVFMSSASVMAMIALLVYAAYRADRVGRIPGGW